MAINLITTLCMTLVNIIQQLTLFIDNITILGEVEICFHVKTVRCSLCRY